jgi:hypothetical protein
MSYEEASMLLVGCSTVEFDVPAWVIPMCYPCLYSITLQCHDRPSAEARVIPPALLKIQRSMMGPNIIMLVPPC